MEDKVETQKKNTNYFIENDSIDDMQSAINQVLYPAFRGKTTKYHF